jgi:serine/threonine-protein phosphatase 2A regulatory subunit B'
MSDAKAPVAPVDIKKLGMDPIDDIGVPTFLTTVEIVRRPRRRHMPFSDPGPLPAVMTADDYPLLVKKLKLCCLLPDFSDPDADLAAKNGKAIILKDLVGVFGVERALNALSQEVIDNFHEMMDINIFRAIPPTPKKYLFADFEPFMVDIAWPHLLLVYALLLKHFAISPRDPHYSLAYETKMIHMFAAPDANERDTIINFFYQYVAVHPDREKQIWIECSNMLLGYRQGDFEPYCVSPILIFLRERLKEPNCDEALSQSIFENSVIPLLSALHFSSSYDKRVDFSVVMMQKNPANATLLVKELMSRWPDVRPMKLILFCQFMNTVLEYVTEEDFQTLCKPLFTLYAQVARHLSSKVVEASFRIWSNVKIIPKILDNARTIYPIMHPAISATMKDHWKSSTQQHALNTLRAMHDIDPFIFDELDLNGTNMKKKGAAVPPPPDPLLVAHETAHQNWGRIARLAGKRDRNLNVSQLLTFVQRSFAAMAPQEVTKRKKGK